MKIVIREYKIDEFVDFLRLLLSGFRKEKGCVDCCVYQDYDEEHAFCIVAKWEAHEAMQKHFLTQKFEVLIGAARVLGERFEMIIAEVLEVGNFKLAKHYCHQDSKNTKFC
jgi:quinol monooxygenase YgiN